MEYDYSIENKIFSPAFKSALLLRVWLYCSGQDVLNFPKQNMSVYLHNFKDGYKDHNCLHEAL